MNLLKFGLILISSLIILSCNKVDLKETTVDLSSHKLATFSVLKSTKYLVVFESGLGDDHKPWNEKNIITEISQFSDVLLMKT